MSWSRREQIRLLERLEIYLSAGLTISASLVLLENSATGKQKSSLRLVHQDIQAGRLLSKSLSEQIGISPTIRSLIGHGESAGQLASAIASANELLVRKDELIKKCLSSLTYPLVIAILALVLTIGLVRGVIPQIAPILSGMKVELPLLTRVVILLSDVLTRYGLVLIVAAVIACIAITFLYKKSIRFKNIIHNHANLMPLMGHLMRSYSLSIFLRSLGTLLGSGATIVSAYREVVQTIDFWPIRKVLAAGTEKVASGEALSDILVHKYIPAHSANLISAGEISGHLDNSLLRAANIIDRDLEADMKKLTSLLEPLMMVGLGGIVGAISLSIMMPIYDMSKILQHAH